MPKNDLLQHSLPRLLAMRDEIDAAIEKKKSQNRDAVFKKVEKLLAENGMTLGELATPARRRSTAKPKKRKTRTAARRKVAPKYCNPKKKSETWAGRGRKPKWVEAHLAAGGKLEDLLIK